MKKDTKDTKGTKFSPKDFANKIRRSRFLARYRHVISFILPIICYIVIAFMAYADASALQQMFGDYLDINGMGSWPIAIVYAICLEGLPVAFTSAWCTLHDEGLAIISETSKKDKHYQQSKARFLFWASLIIFIVVAIYVACLRYTSITRGGSINWKSRSLPSDLGMMLSPIFSSLCATSLSLLANKSYSLDASWRNLKKAQHDYNLKRAAYMNSFTRLDSLRVALWSSLVTDQPMPTKSRNFRKQCMERTRCKLLADCAIAYPHHLNHFNAEIECALTQYLETLSHLTTIPEEFRNLNIQQLMDEYDSHFTENMDKWNYHKSNDAMLQELIDLLNNELLIRQYRAAAASANQKSNPTAHNKQRKE